MRFDVRDLPMLGIAAALLALLGLGGVVANEVRHQATARERVTHSFAVLLELQRIESSVAECESGLRGYSIAREPAFLDRFDQDFAEVRTSFVDARQLTRDNAAQQDRFDGLAPVLERRLVLLVERRDALLAGGAPGTPPEARILTAQIRDRIAAMREAERQLLDIRRKETEGRSRSVVRWAQGGAAISLLTGLAALGWMARERRLRQQIEAQLVDKHGMVDAVIEGTTDAVFTKDLEGRYLMINTAGARLLGKTIGEVLGRYDTDLFAEGSARDIADRDLEILRAGAARTFEATSTANGITRTWLSTRAPYRDANGRIIGLVGISRDITDRKAAEDGRFREMTLLLELAELLQACRTPADAHEVIARMGARLFPQVSGGISLIHPSRNLVELRASWGAHPVVHDGLFGPDDCWALRRGRPHLAAGDYGMACRHGTGTCATSCTPLLAQGEVLGVLHLAAPEDLIDPVVQRRAAFVGEQVSMAIANLELRETLRTQSSRDPLTGLYNRRFTEDALRREILRAARHGGTLATLMMDLDHFKRINDTFGHDAGDRVLREVGAVMLASTRGEDVASRVGGEELVLVLPGIGPDDAWLEAERLREKVAGLNVLRDGVRIGPVTVSIGIAMYPAHGATSEQLLQAADVALYAAKRGGRNRVVWAEATPPAAFGVA